MCWGWGFKSWHAEGGLTERRASSTSVTLHLHPYDGCHFSQLLSRGSEGAAFVGFCRPAGRRRSPPISRRGRDGACALKGCSVQTPALPGRSGPGRSGVPGAVLAAPSPPLGSARGCPKPGGRQCLRPSLGDHLGPSAAGADAATLSRVWSGARRVGRGALAGSRRAAGESGWSTAPAALAASQTGALREEGEESPFQRFWGWGFCTPEEVLVCVLRKRGVG